MTTRLGVALGGLLTVAAVWWWLSRTPDPSPPAALPDAVANYSPHFETAPATAPSDSITAWLAQGSCTPRRVAGHVVFEGHSVAGAVVRLEPSVFGAGMRAKELRTGEDGAFDFGDQPPMRYAVGAAAAGRTGAVVDVDLRDPTAVPAPDALELVLTACNAKLVGHVLDSAGGPIVRARVRPSGGPDVFTAAGGEYELCLPPGQNTVRVEADGYGPVRLALLVLGRTSRDVVLTPEALIVGRVNLKETGEPVEGAVVLAFSSVMGSSESSGGLTVSGPDGRFRLSVAPGDYGLIAYSKTATTASVVQSTAMVGRLSEEVLLRLWTRSTLKGTVRSGGKPVGGAHVVAIANSGNGRAEAVSQVDGTFVMSRVQQGEVTFTAGPFAVLTPAHFVVAKAVESVELEVKRQGSLRGVVTRGGKAVGGATVTVSNGVQSSVAHSEPSGRYEVLGLAAGRYRVLAQSPLAGGFVEEPAIQLADTEDRTLDLELRNGDTIAGHVVTEAGEPVVGALVVFRLSPGGDEGRSVTDSDGSFLCNQMTGGGEYVPTVFSSPGSRAAYPPVGAQSRVVLTDGSSHAEGVTLTVKYERLRISGRVVDADSQAIPDVRVRAVAAEAGQRPYFSPWAALPSALSDAQGTFAIDGLTSGSWALQATAPEGGETILPAVEAGARDVLVMVHRAGVIEGTLTGFDEPPSVYAHQPGQPKLVPGQVDGATFRVTGVSPGSYILSAMNTHEGDAQRVDVKEGAVTKVAMVSHGKAVVAGAVIDHVTRAPVAGLVCHVVLTAGGQQGVTNWDLDSAPRTNLRGEFEVDPSPAGPIDVSCFGDMREYSPATAQLTVGRGERASVPLEVVHRLSPDTPGDVGVEMVGATPVISAVSPAGPAGRAGVAVGDVVVAVDGVPTTPLNAWGVQALIGNHRPGTQVALSLTHGGEPRVVNLVAVAPRR